jgi:metallo-beta-lactamase class B
MSKTTFRVFAAALFITGFFQLPLAAQQGQAANQGEQRFKESKAAQAHVASAMAIAKSDLIEEAQYLCTWQGPQRPAELRQQAGLPPIPDQQIEPARIFDNLYYIGFNDVGAWALTTSEGIILIDSLNTPEEAEKVLIPGMQKVGLDPKQIKYVILGHGHFDHFGGAPYLQTTYKARVAMGGPDWDLIARPPAANAPPQQRNRPLPTRDIVVTGEQMITLGDTTVKMILTPGHTPGSIAILFPIKERGRQYSALILNGGFTVTDRKQFDTLKHVIDVAKKQKTVALLQSHPGMVGDTLAAMETRRKNPAAPNPFFYEEARFARFTNIITECAEARLIVSGDSQ